MSGFQSEMVCLPQNMCHNGAAWRSGLRARFQLEPLSTQSLARVRPLLSDLAAGLLSMRSSSSEENDLPPAAFRLRSDSLRRITPPGLPGGRVAPEHSAAERRRDSSGGGPSAPALPAFLGGTMIPAAAFPRVQGSLPHSCFLPAGRRRPEPRYSQTKASPLLGGSPGGIETL